MKNTICLFALLAAVSLSVRGQAVSSEWKLPAIKADNALIVRTSNPEITVTCVNDADNRSCFIVERDSITKFFYTTETPSASPGLPSPVPAQRDSGYIVKSIFINRTDCWFCGTRWYWNGEYDIDINGNGTPYITYSGFIGRFNAYAALHDTVAYEIMRFPVLREVSKMTQQYNHLTAIGSYATGDKRIVEAPFVGGDTIMYRLYRSSNSNEVFMDIANSEDSIALLSRFWGMTDTMRNHFFFGLRYGIRYNFAATSGNNYLYSVNNIPQGPVGRFTGVTPLFLTPTTLGNGMVVSQVSKHATSSPYENLKGSLFAYHVPGEGAETIHYFVNRHDDAKEAYRELKSAHCAVGYGNRVYFLPLLEDSTGYSSIWFPYINNTTTPPSTQEFFRVWSPELESIVAYFDSTDNLCFETAGYYAEDSLKVARMNERRILSHSGSSAQCHHPYNGQTYSKRRRVNVWQDESSLVLESAKPTSISTTIVLSHECTPIGICIDGVQPNQ